MDLARLGKVAGIGGIAVGASVLVLRPLTESVLPGLPPEARAQAVLVIAIGAFALGGFGIIAWLVGNRAGRRGQLVTAGRDAAVGGRDAYVNSKVSRPSEGGETGGTGEQTDRVYQQVRAGRDAAVGGRDAAVNSTVRQTPDADRHGPRGRG